MKLLEGNNSRGLVTGLPQLGIQQRPSRDWFIIEPTIQAHNTAATMTEPAPSLGGRLMQRFKLQE